MGEGVIVGKLDTEVGTLVVEMADIGLALLGPGVGANHLAQGVADHLEIGLGIDVLEFEHLQLGTNVLLIIVSHHGTNDRSQENKDKDTETHRRLSDDVIA